MPSKPRAFALVWKCASTESLAIFVKLIWEIYWRNISKHKRRPSSVYPVQPRQKL
jgi:hypothetical protein